MTDALDIDLDTFGDALHEFEIDVKGLDAFDIDSDTTAAVETRYTKPRLTLTKNDIVKYDNAEDLAKKTRIGEGQRLDAVVSGNFVFGDYIGAYLTTYDIKATTMTINTLSMGADNVMMLKTLMEFGYIDRLNLIVSHYFYQHHRDTIVKLIYDELDNDDNTFQMAVCGTHMKVVTFETLGGKHICLHGSANLRSSANIEQFTIEENKELYDFYEDIHKIILDRYSTINHALRRNALRDAIGIEPTKTRRKGGVTL